MGSITAPHPSSVTQGTKRIVYWQRILLLSLALLLSAGGIVYWQSQAQRSSPAAVSTAPVLWANLNVTVESSGRVAPGRSRDLAFRVAGTVAEVLVHPGAQVKAGQALARLDDRVLRRAVAQAEIDVRSAEALVAKARDGEVRPAELAEANARIAAAQAQLQQTRQGTTRPADIANAEAALRAAEARLDKVLHPTADDQAAAETAVAQAHEQLALVRAERSAAKTNAEADMTQAANALRTAQQKRSDAYQQLSKLSEQAPGYTAVKGAYEQALRDEQDADSRLQQARVRYEAARAQEISAVEGAEAELTSAEATLNALRSPDARAITEARASAHQARAVLQKLRQGPTHAEISAAQAAVSQAQAQREALGAPAAASAIAEAEANLAQAKLNLAAAQENLQAAVLQAPFAGTIATVALSEGAQVNTANPALTLIDTSSLEIVLKLNEYDVQQVQIGQNAQLSFESLPDQNFTGSVTAVAPVSTQDGNLSTYAVTLRFDPKGHSFKIGMTGDASITVATRENAIQVPNNALQGDGDIRTVQVHHRGASSATQVMVQTGLSNGVMTEVLGCLPARNPCLVEGDQVEVNSPADLSTTNEMEQGKGLLVPAPANGGPARIPIYRPADTP